MDNDTIMSTPTEDLTKPEPSQDKSSIKKHPSEQMDENESNHIMKVVMQTRNKHVRQKRVIAPRISYWAND